MATPLLQQLTDAFRCLPGVGPKSAQRMALHVLERDKAGWQRLAQTLTRAIDTIGHCAQCRTLTEQPVCALCQIPQRDVHTLCVVETPADVLALEQAAHYQGNYFVLGGRLSPLDNIGPKDLGLDQLRERLQTSTIYELILATTTTVEGEATAAPSLTPSLADTPSRHNSFFIQHSAGSPADQHGTTNAPSARSPHLQTPAHPLLPSAHQTHPVIRIARLADDPG